MSVSLMLHLFGKPEWELNEVTPEQLRALGKNLHARLERAADIVEKLGNAGWEIEMALYDVCMSHPYLDTKAAVEEKLQDLGIDPEEVHIEELPEEDEEEEPEEEPEME
jgi:ferredoxin-NADP reductase